MGHVLIVDDEPALCWSLAELVQDLGHSVQTAGSVSQAAQRLAGTTPDVIVLDVRLPDGDGLTALTEFRKSCPAAEFVVMTAFGDLQTATRSLGSGAFEYLIKPFDLKTAAEVIQRAMVHEDQPATIAELSPGATLIGRSLPMQHVFRQIALVAGTPFPVLLQGETGTGKEVAARAIHQHSSAASGPFVAVALASLNPALVESELFGHVRGAFTGATERRPGLFELASGGTLFLDEIAETPISLQVKLLRVLETRRYSPVGSGEEMTTSARFVTATHKDLQQAIGTGTFREDLFHRLSSFSITLPALRERLDDLPLLVSHFLDGLAAALRPSGVSSEFMEALRNRTWPGNVRELRNVIDHAVIMARGQQLRPEHLPCSMRQTHDSTDVDSGLSEAFARWVRARLRQPECSELYRSAVQMLDASLIPVVLGACDNNRTAAARILGLDRATLRAKLREIPAADGHADDIPSGLDT